MRVLARHPDGTISECTLQQLHEDFLAGRVTADWLARRPGEAEFRSIAEVLFPPSGVLASVGLRYLAKIVDLTIVLGPAFLVAIVDETTAGVMIMFGWLMYNWFMVAIRGATVGKRMVGAVVVDKYDRRCGWGRAFGRALLEYTYLLPLIWIISVIALSLSKESRNSLDHTAGTRVVRRDSVRHLFSRPNAVQDPPLVSPRTHPGDFEQQIRKLARLRDDGLITETDFEQKKRDILGL